MAPPNWPAAGTMHFRLEHPNLGVLDLAPARGYVVSSYDLGHPEPRAATQPNSLDDGTFDVTRFYGARAVTLDVTLKAHEGIDKASSFLSAEAELRDRLLAYTQPGSRVTLLFSEHRDDRVKQVMLRGTEASIAVSQEAYNKVNVSWVAPRGSLYGYDRRTYLFVFNQSTADTQTKVVVNAGSAPAHWVMVLGGEVIRPRIILNDDQALHLDYPAALGDTIVFDSFSRTVTINGVNTGHEYLDDLDEWFMLPPGTSTLTVEHDTYTTVGYPPAYWQPSSWVDDFERSGPDLGSQWVLGPATRDGEDVRPYSIVTGAAEAVSERDP